MAESKFTAEAQDALLERFAAGCSIPDACASVGISQKTVKGWLTRGRQEDDGPYAVFAAAVDDVRGHAELPSAMDADELAQVVSEAARRGNTQAMKLRWEMLRAEAPEDEAPAADPFAEFDELAARRATA